MTRTYYALGLPSPLPLRVSPPVPEDVPPYREPVIAPAPREGLPRPRLPAKHRWKAQATSYGALAGRKGP